MASPSADYVVASGQVEAAIAVLRHHHIDFEPRALTTFAGQPAVGFSLHYQSWQRARDLLEGAGLPSLGPVPRPADDLLLRWQITGGVKLTGASRPGNRVDTVFLEPRLEPSPVTPRLVWASLDIETARDGTVRAVALTLNSGAGQANARERVLFLGDFASERALLEATNDLVREYDPDVITGWNVLDFDLAHLADRYTLWKLPFAWGRTDESVRVRKKPGGRTSAFVAGRQVVDAMRIARGSGTRFEDQTLATVASHVLGRTKTVELKGEAKLTELDRLFADEPAAFCDYCLEDARLVLGILEVTGLGELTVRRASLTGVSLDLAWTSIPVFERIYGMELARRGVLAPPDEGRDVSGAAGGMVLDAKVGLFSDVVVFDFRSLYPSIIRTFGIDPLGYERAGDDALVAPNGARFSREAGILPALITRYFADRQAAQSRGDETASYVYKILMNSFYGVLGSSGCRYGRTALAGAITGFGRRCLEYTRDWFEAREMPVLYGDTDSVFVQTRRDAEALAADLTRDLAALVSQAWKVESYLTLRCDKRYRRFLIPPMRHLAGEEARGRAKGYAGWVEQPEGTLVIDVKGMEAVRSDWTPLARRFQTELLERLFRGEGAGEVGQWCDELLGQLRRGELDSELVYRKILRRPAQEYTGNTPPQVKAARLLGWTDQRGSVEYWMTAQGPWPLALAAADPSKPTPTLDYDHYREHQLRPIWESLLEAAGFDPGPVWGRQMELFG
ncbi:MAG: DNA polymerase domain-containing protein [Spirochaetales bacterium]